MLVSYPPSDAPQQIPGRKIAECVQNASSYV